MTGDVRIVKIKGYIETDDGQFREFQITEDGSSQWGNTTECLGDTVDALGEMTDLLRQNEYLVDFPDEDDDESAPDSGR